jgi:hypothetical protein
MPRSALLALAALGTAGFALARPDHPHADALEAKTVAWLRANNTYGPDHRIVTDVGGAVEKKLKEGKNFTMLIGPKLTKSGKAGLLASAGDEVFAFDLTAEQFERTKNAPTRLQMTDGHNAEDPVLTPVPIKLTRPTIKGGMKVNGSKEISGELPLTKKTDFAERVALRMVLARPGANTGVTLYYHPISPQIPYEWKMPFQYPAINAKRDAGDKVTGPTVAIFDLCVIDNRRSEVTVVSNLVAVLIDVE